MKLASRASWTVSGFPSRRRTCVTCVGTTASLASLACACLFACAQIADVAGDYVEVVDAGGNADVGCVKAKPPGPPKVRDAGGDLALVLAVRTVDFHEDTDGEGIGFDLDGSCTCQGEEPSCRPPADTKPEDLCDWADGRDNHASRLIADSAILGLSSKQLNEQIAQGEWSVLFRIAGYNGLPDDDQVEVSWLVPLNRMAKPNWDGTDAWGIDGKCLHQDGAGNPDMDNPRVIDKAAYVTAGKLVASVRGGAPIDLAGDVTFVANDSYVVADLEPSGEAWSISFGILAGVWRTSDLLATLPAFTPGGQPLCTDNPIYPMVKDNICRHRDILGGIGLPSAACDSISFAFTFTAAPAVLGYAILPEPPPSPCEPQHDPANDSCD